MTNRQCHLTSFASRDTAVGGDVAFDASTSSDSKHLIEVLLTAAVDIYWNSRQVHDWYTKLGDTH
jgi:hypothetical protein